MMMIQYTKINELKHVCEDKYIHVPKRTSIIQIDLLKFYFFNNKILLSLIHCIMDNITQHDECCICFDEIVYNKDTIYYEICNVCALTCKERDELGRLLHPVTRGPMKTCVCGELVTRKCSREYFSTINAYICDTALFTQCKTPQERLALQADPTVMVKIKQRHGLI